MIDIFELEVVSHLPQFTGKVLKPWFLDGIDTIGVWGEEPFELKFRNKTGQKVQLRLSVDGTDVLTGKKANTNTDNEGMWVVDAWGTMSLKAWPETNKKGRSFIFGKTGDSVAANTHGDLSNKGIIAAAVFTETYKPYVSDVDRYYNRFRELYWDRGLRSCYDFDGIVYNQNRGDMKGIADAPAVGAGQEIVQTIGKAQGLVQPKLDRIVRVRYLWWDEVEAKLVKQGFVKFTDGHPTGFPGDREEKLANLGNTPTIGGVKHYPVQIQRFV